MNQKQKIVLWLGFGIIAIMGLFPPWVGEYQFAEKDNIFVKGKVNAGYSFLFAPSIPTHKLFIGERLNQITNDDESAKREFYRMWDTIKKVGCYLYLDLSKLIFQILLVSILSGGLIYIFKTS